MARSNGTGRAGKRTLFTTGDPDAINRHSARYFGAPAIFSQAKL